MHILFLTITIMLILSLRQSEENIVIPENFTKESEQFRFFSQMWSFGKYASQCRHKELYLNISKIIIEELARTDDFAVLIQPLNKFYAVMAKYWNIDNRKDEEWSEFVTECDSYLDTLAGEQKKFMGDIFVVLGQYLQKISSAKDRENEFQDNIDKTEVSINSNNKNSKHIGCVRR